MLSFISFWKAAAIVLCDLGSSAFYAGGIAETAVGKSAPWFILAIMLLAYAVRAVYIESCGMFVRGGVYKVVHEALGGTLAKFSVSALLFDYVLTGPISAVSAGLYIAGLLNETVEAMGHHAWMVPPKMFAAGFAIVVTVYFWRKNIIGMHESSQKALRIMQITTVMVVILIFWALLTVFLKGYQPVPLPSASNFRVSSESLGWLNGTGAEQLVWVLVLIGIGHSLLAMSGYESLAQVNREIAHPKLKNLQKTGTVVFVYSLVFTSMVSFFAVMLIPDKERTTVFIDNLIGGLAMHLSGPLWARLTFHSFVVVVGAIILSGAVNTAILGSNGVLNRVAEDGVLPDALRKPHKRFGTTSRLINLIVGLQLITILISRGDLYLLGEAYAFGVVWSFAMKSLSVLVLRYKQPEKREWRVPLNFKFGSFELPLGLVLITAMLFALAIVNLLTKKTATISGILFTVTFFILFEISEKVHKRHRKAGDTGELEKFNLEEAPAFENALPQARPGGVLVAVRNPNRLDAVQQALDKTNTREMDIVVMTVKNVTSAGSGEHDLDPEQVFSTDIQVLFSKVVTLAEKAGKHVELLVVPGTDPNEVILETAAKLKSGVIMIGVSGKMPVDAFAKSFGDAWETLPAPRPKLSLEIVSPEMTDRNYINLGPHPPRLWPEDEDLLHRLWLEMAQNHPGQVPHHRDIVRVALRRLERDWHSGRHAEIVGEVEDKHS
jgi:amino acid transporter/nucleotide-binding universal stress UspA family protein